MPVTITLTDDQALEIVAQLGNMLKKNAGEKAFSKENKLPQTEQFRAAVLAMPKGKLFRCTILAANLGLTTQAFSSAMKPLVEEKQVERVHKGTWKRL